MIRLAPGLALPPEAVTNTFGILAKRGAGKSNAGAVMAEEMHAAGLQFVVVDPVGAWWGLRSSADGKGAGLPIPILGGYHGDVPLEPGGGELVADLVVDERLSCVIDVSSFESEGQKRKFLIAFAERLFRQKGRPQSLEPLHLFLEEADDYAPQRASGVEMNRCLGAFQRIVKRGRGRGLGSTMISQRSAALNKDLLTQIDTLIALRTTSPNDRKAIEGWVIYHDTDNAILSSLSELKAGEAWVWSPEFLGVVKRVQIRRRHTFDSGATPTAGAKRRAPATLADVDLGALEARMTETIERAKETDPRELQSRVRVLEKELALVTDAAAQIQTEVQVERVEVPVLDIALVERIEATVDRSVERLAEAYNTAFAPLLELASEAKKALGRIERGNGHRAARVPAATQRRAGPPAPRQARTSDSSPSREAPKSEVGITKPQQRILDALAWLESVRITQAKKGQLALLAGQSPKSSGYTNNLGALRTAGLIEYPAGGVVVLTDAGRSVAEPPAAPPTNEDLWATLEAKLSNPQWRILRALIANYPVALFKEELAERAEQSPTSSGFTNNLGTLRSLGFIDYPAPREVVALPVLFIDGGGA